MGKGNKQGRSVPLVKLERFYDAKQPIDLSSTSSIVHSHTYRLTLSIAVCSSYLASQFVDTVHRILFHCARFMEISFGINGGTADN